MHFLVGKLEGSNTSSNRRTITEMRKEIYFLLRFAMNPLVASATDSEGSETASWSPVIDFQVK